MNVCGIDPGTTETAFVVWDGMSVIDTGTVPNEVFRAFLRARLDVMSASRFVIEMVACYGMPVGKEVFQTCVWIGRFIERAPVEPELVFRKDIKMHLCGTVRAKDGNVRQALIDKHGAPGTKKAPGKTYGISGHLWAALAVADYALTHE